MPVRALENGVFTVTTNRVGSESNGRQTLSFIGQSVICSPSAEVLASATESEAAVITAAFNPRDSRSRAINEYNDRLGDRRPDLYAR